MYSHSLNTSRLVRPLAPAGIRQTPLQAGPTPMKVYTEVACVMTRQQVRCDSFRSIASYGQVHAVSRIG
jgi:hypothetical protein